MNLRLLVLPAFIAIAAAVIFAARVSGPTPTEAGPTCASYGEYHQLAGHWDGEWNNTTFQTNGTVTVDATINPDCSAQVIIEKEPGTPWTVDATYHDTVDGVAIEVHGDPIFGDTTVAVTGNGFTIEGSMSYYGIKHFVATGTLFSLLHIEFHIDMTFNNDSTAEEDVTLHRDSTPTPLPTEEPTSTPEPTSTVGVPTPTPQPTLGNFEITWGDSDCDTSITTRDNQALLRAVLSQPPLSAQPRCPGLGDTRVFGAVSTASVPQGDTIVHAWGDWDCDGDVTSRDNQALLRNILAQNPLSQAEGCPALGDPLILIAD